MTKKTLNAWKRGILWEQNHILQIILGEKQRIKRGYVEKAWKQMGKWLWDELEIIESKITQSPEDSSKLCLKSSSVALEKATLDINSRKGCGKPALWVAKNKYIPCGEGELCPECKAKKANSRKGEKK